MSNIKIEEGKYYRTQDGRKVGPARKINDDFTWARWHSGGEILEVVGVRREDAFDTKLVSEWTNTPKLWRDMTDEEKGALLLAHHEGKVIEWNGTSAKTGEWTGWEACDDDCLWDGDFDGEGFAYRIKPEPVREVERVTIVNADNMKIGYGTIETVDGKPDCASIKMERL